MAKTSKPKSKSAGRAARRKPTAPVPAGFLFHPVTGKPRRSARVQRSLPLSPEELEAARNEHIKRKAASTARRAADVDAVRKRREVLRKTASLPARVQTMLMRSGPSASAHAEDLERMTERRLQELLEMAFLEGCQQGFAEGQLVYRERTQEKSQKANAAKRAKTSLIAGRLMTLDERDAAIARAFPALARKVGSTQAHSMLAEQYGLESAKQIGNIIRRAKTSQETP